MARLRVLELPVVHRGDKMETPFVLVIDQLEDTPMTMSERESWSQLRIDTGAVACIFFEDSLDLE